MFSDVSSIQYEKYNSLLSRILSQSDSILLVDPTYVYDHNFLDELELKLSEDILESGYTKEWPGTISENTKYLRLSISEYIKNILYNSKSFISGTKRTGFILTYSDNNIDLSFFKKEECLAYTITHEGKVYVNNDILLT